jgi:hypothetical protein
MDAENGLGCRDVAWSEVFENLLTFLNPASPS